MYNLTKIKKKEKEENNVTTVLNRDAIAEDIIQSKAKCSVFSSRDVGNVNLQVMYYKKKKNKKKKTENNHEKHYRCNSLLKLMKTRAYAQFYQYQILNIYIILDLSSRPVRMCLPVGKRERKENGKAARRIRQVVYKIHNLTAL
ncbi:hypothetical protein PUN28_011052 [Cardiocondyla obscurior]|uniref:Uncharacterized protein n=1 Tax=Cardiocondyla obscurior TaxID=286306 RepID=A0AAW2FL40_9HYME